MRNLLKRYLYILVPIILLILLRIPSLIEPLWYGDEGIYSAVSKELFNGEVLYKNIWDHKTPGIYYLYSIFLAFPQIYVFAYKFLNLLLALFSLIMFYKIINIEFSNKHVKIQFIIYTIFSILFGSTVLEGNILNAENIFIPLVLFGIYFIFKLIKTNRIYWWEIMISGLSFGLAFLFKLQPFFELIIIIYSILVVYIHDKNKKLIKPIILVSIISLIPLVAITIYFWSIGVGKEYIRTVFLYNFVYSSGTTVKYMIFGIRDSIYIRTIISGILILVVSILYLKNTLSRRIFIALCWLFMNMWIVRISDRGYAHYFMELIPAFLYLLSLFLIVKISYKLRVKVLFGYIISFILFLFVFAGPKFSGFIYVHPIKYYIEGYKCLTINQCEQWSSVMNYEQEKVEEIHRIIGKYKGKNVFFWGNVPWAYYYSDIRNSQKYTVYFHYSKEELENIDFTYTDLILINKGVDSLPHPVIELINKDFILDYEDNDYILYKKLNYD